MTRLSRLTLLSLQFLPQRRVRAVEDCLRRWRDLLVEVHARDPSHAFGALSSYVLYTTNMSGGRLGRLLRELIGPQAEERVMSTAERLIQKGRKQGHTEGRTEGRTEGQADLLLRLMSTRFGPLTADVEQRVRKGTVADLQRWADAILAARTLDEVLAG